MTLLRWPITGRVSQEYGVAGHPGIDIAAPVGTPIEAAADGLVVQAANGWNGGYGNYTVIDHGNGVTTAYAHQSLIAVRPGQRVRAGEVIGAVGSTGHSTGPHLHLEDRTNGKTHNPRDDLGPGEPKAGTGTGTPMTSDPSTLPGSSPSSSTSGPLSLFAGATAARAGLIVLGALVVLVGLVVMFHNAGGVAAIQQKGEADDGQSPTPAHAATG